MNAGPFLRRPLDYWILWVLVLGSLTVNGVLANGLLTARARAAQATGDVAGVLGSLNEASIDAMIEIDEEVPVRGSVPFETVVHVPIDTKIPVNTIVAIPIALPLVGPYVVRLPIIASIPVKLDIEVPIDYDVPVSIDVPVKLSVPIHIAFAETELGVALQEGQALFEKWSKELEG